MIYLRRLSIFVLLVSVVIGVGFWYFRLPYANGLGFYTTARQAVRAGNNLSGKNIIITGGHSGIGVANVEALAPYKPNMWLLARPGDGMSRCENFAAAVRIQSNNPNIYCEEMDLGEFDTIVRFAERWKKENRPIHILILNAGVGFSRYRESANGIQYIWQANHLGHFLLTNLLLENLKLGKPSRVVVVSSSAHWVTNINWDDISGSNTWYHSNSSTWWIDSLLAYGQSKTANILFANKLNELLKGYGVANSLHPGMIRTPILRDAEDHFMGVLLDWFEWLVAKTVSQGAATQVYVATAPELENIGGEYFEDCNLSNWSRAPHTRQKENDDRLWELSLKMVSKWLIKDNKNSV